MGGCYHRRGATARVSQVAGRGETGGRVPVRGTVSGPCLASCAPLMRTLAGTPAIASVYDKDSQNRRLAEMSANQLFTKSATKYKV